MNETTVLFVDDEREIRNSLKRRMKSEPYRCEFASSGPEALNIMAREEIHLLVTDMRMPEMDGLTLIQEAAKQYPEMVRIVLSGMSDSDTILTALNEGDVHRYITKPWDDRELKITIRQAVQLHELKHERRRLLERLETKNRQLERDIQERISQLMSIQGQAEIGRYTSQIVHNLSTPLQALTSALDLMDFICSQCASEVDPKLIESKLQMAQTAVKDLKQIVQGILGRSRKEIVFQFERVDINDIVRQEIDYHLLNPEFDKNIDKTVLLSASLPPILGNSIQIKQVVGNLINNAIDALEDAPIKNLTFETDHRNGQAILRIIDTGCGISESDLEKIYDPGYTTKPLGKGTGLGLASVKEIVSAYNGTIDVTSTPGQGTTFEVRIPVACAPASVGNGRDIT